MVREVLRTITACSGLALPAVAAQPHAFTALCMLGKVGALLSVLLLGHFIAGRLKFLYLESNWIDDWSERSFRDEVEDEVLIPVNIAHR